MPECHKLHKVQNNELANYGEILPHFYIAGQCINDPANHGGCLSFLKATYPCYQSEDYEDSKRYHGELIPIMSMEEHSEITEKMYEQWQTS